MTLKYFNVKNGLTTGNIILNASNSSISASTFIGNINVTATATLGDVGNVKITGGSSGYVLQTDGTGNLSWVAQSGGSGGTPGGSNTQVQFNDNGTFGGNSVFTFNNTTGLLTVPTIQVTDDIYPNANGVADLGTDTNRFNDLYLSGSTIKLANSLITSNATALVLTNPSGGKFVVTGTGNASTTSIANGNSNVNVNETSVVISANGNSSIATVTGVGVSIQGNLSATSDISTQGNMSVSGNVYALNAEFNGAVTTTGNLSAGNLSTTGNIAATGNVSAGNLNSTGQLGVIGNTNITGNLEVTANSVFKSRLTVGSSNTDPTAVNLYPNGYGQFSNAAVANNFSASNISVSGTANLGTLNVNTVNALGNLSTTENLSVTKSITAGNANLGNLVTANFFQGDGYLLTNITVQAGTSIVNGNSNVVVTPNSNVVFSVNGTSNVVTVTDTGVVIDGTSGLTISSGNLAVVNNVNVTGNVTAPQVQNGNSNVRITANGNVAISASGTQNKLVISNTSVNVSGNLGVTSSIISNSVNANSIFATTGNFSGNITALNANLGNLVTANFFQGDGYLLTNLTIETGTTLINGNSNVVVENNANVVISAAGNANILSVTGDSVILTKPLIGTTATLTTGNITTINSNTLNVQNALTVNADITANGRVTSERLLVQKVGGLAGTATIEGNLTAEDNLFVSGYANIPVVNVTNLNASTNVKANNTVTGNNITAGILLKSSGNLLVEGSSNLQTFIATTGNLSGNLTALNANLGNLVTANFFQGDGYLLTNLTVEGGTSIVNGNSNVFVDANSNVRFSINGTPNVLVVGNTTTTVNNGLTVVGNTNVTNLNVSTNILTSGISSNGNISGSNLTISNVANISGNLTALNANLGNLVTANFFQGDGYLLTNLTVEGGTSIVNGNSNVLVTANSDVLVSVEGVANVVRFTPEGVRVNGNIISTQGLSNGNTNINMLANSDIFITVGGNANITRISQSALNVSVKLNAFGGLLVSGNSNVGNLSASGTIAAGGEISAGSFDTSGALRVGGNSNIANLYATGSLTSIGNLTSGNVRTTGTANVGTLIVTTAGANITGNSSIDGNLTIDGFSTFINSNALAIRDSIVSIGKNINNQPLTSNDGNDRGLLLSYYTTTPVDAFMGWDNSNAEFAFGSNVDINSGVITFNTLGNLRAGYFLGNFLGNVSGNIAAPGSTTQVVFNDGGYINATSGFTFQKSNNLATIGNLNITGLITGNGAGISNIAGNNVTGQVANALVAGTVYTNAQPNITSLGLLSGLSIGPNSGLIMTGTSGYVRANSIQGTDGVNSLYLAYSGSPGAVGITTNLTVGIGATGNITANGNIVANQCTGNGFTISSNTGQVNFSNASVVSLGSASTIKITGGTANYVLSTDGTGNLSWVAQSGGGGGSMSLSDVETNATFYPVFANATTGTMSTAYLSSSTLSFNPSSGTLNVQDLNTLSDQTLKEDPTVIEDPMSVIKQLFGMGFKWKNSGKKSYGLMAQMLEIVLPELVTTTQDGKKTVNYIPLIAFLIEAVKKQQDDIDELKKR